MSLEAYSMPFRNTCLIIYGTGHAESFILVCGCVEKNSNYSKKIEDLGSTLGNNFYMGTQNGSKGKKMNL